MKRIVSVFISALLIVMALPNFSSSYAASQTNNELYNRADTLVKALGIADETFNSDTEITRAKAADFAVKIMNLKAISYSDYEENPFSDVSAETAYASAVLACNSIGYMVGIDKGIFAPDAVIKKEHFLKVVEYCAGYRNKVEATSIVAIANELKLLNGVGNTDLSQNLTYRDAIAIIYNVLNAEMFNLSSISNDGVYYQTNGETVLMHYHDIIKHEGFVHSDSTTNYFGSYIPAVGNVLIDNTEYISGNSNAEGFLGCYVEFYSKKSLTDKYEIICLSEIPNKNGYITINSELVKDFSGNTIKYYVSKSDDSVKNVRIASNAKVIYNGKYDGVIENCTLSDFNFPTGYIKLVDIGEDSGYDYVFITEYDVFTIDSVSNKSVSFKYNKMLDGKNYLELDSESEKYKFTIKIDGVISSPIDLIEYDVVNIARSRDKSYIIIEVFFDSAEGEIEEVKDNGEKIVVDGREFEVNNEFYALTGISLNPGDKIIGYCDYNGKIAAVMEQNSNDYRYAYLLDYMFEEKLFGEGSGLLKIFSDKGEVVVLTMREKIEFYNGSYPTGTTVESKNMESYIKNSNGKYHQIIMYTVDDNEKVASLYLHLDNTTNLNPDYPFRSDFFGSGDDTRLYTGIVGQRFKFSSTAPVFYLPGNKDDEDAYKVTNSLPIFSTNLTLYNCDPHTTVPAVATIDSELSEVANALDLAACIVESVSSGINRKGEIVPIVNYYERNKLSKAAVSDMNKEPFSNQKDENSGGDWYYGVKVSELKAGDIVQLDMDDFGEIRAIRVLFRPSDTKGEWWMKGGTDAEIFVNYSDFTNVNQLTVVYGTVTRNYASVIKVQVTDAGDKWTLWPAGKTAYTIFDTESETIMPATLNDIQSGDKIVSRKDYYQAPNEIFIIR